MNPVLIWDLPTRLFHWLLSAGFIAAAVISLGMGEHSPLFPYHGIIGLTIALMVVIRIVWGIVGTRYARFGSFIFGPGAVVEYMKGAIIGGGKRHIGHNPGSSVAIFALLALVLALAVTGFMTGRGNEAVKEVHEILAWTTVGVVVVHVMGVAFHTIRHRENITASMIHGRKRAEASNAITSSKPIVAALFLIIAGGWAVGLVRNYDPATQTTTLPLFGTALRLGENERGEGGDLEQRRRHEDDD
ncbi:MAG: cytochrome b/b6 domain-containing protein [Phycisphaeraceae bacterium]|nr:cytochrome b/b6 domain-containing protein [Phycisphaeraceae bacterium]